MERQRPNASTIIITDGDQHLVPAEKSRLLQSLGQTEKAARKRFFANKVAKASRRRNRA